MVIHPSYYDACDVSCDVIYYVIAVRARRMVRILFLPYLGNRSKSDPFSYELFCLESHILSFPKVLQIPPESLCTLYWQSTCHLRTKCNVRESDILILFHQNAASFVLSAVLSMVVPKLTSASRLRSAFSASPTAAPLQDRHWNTKQMLWNRHVTPEIQYHNIQRPLGFKYNF